MQRTLLIALATVVMAAAVATGATIIFTGDDQNAISSPPVVTQTPSATTQVTTPSPSASGQATGSPQGTAAPTSTPDDRSSPSPTPKIRSAASVRCSDEPTFCSAETGQLEVADGKREALSVTKTNTSYSGVPKIDMDSKALGPNEKEAGDGEEVGSLHVEVVVRNDTSKTFVFPRREIVLDIYRNGTFHERLETTGDGFEMTPGGEMTGKFDSPVEDDGTYTWRAKTWYYAK